MSFETPVPPYTSADPYATFVGASCFDFLLIELVPLANRMAVELAAREEEWTRGVSIGNVVKRQSASSTGPREANAASTGGLVDEDETKEAVYHRLESLGYRVGLGVVERFSRDRPRFTDALDVIKFLCKDLWTLIFRKQIDNLKTNHRGTYVLTDNTFKPLTRMSLPKARDGTLENAQPFLYFPAGLIRGALASMDIIASVHAETSALPGATFQIRTAGARS